MPEQRFTITESTYLLDVDRVTLMRWLQLETMQPSTDPRDRRYKYLSRDQLLHLAQLHGKTIRDETSIGSRLTNVQKDMLARIQALEEQVAMLQREIGRLTRSEPRHSLYPLPPAPEHIEPIEPPERAYTPSGAMGARDKLKPGEWRTLPPIPPGWVSPLDLARELGVSPRTFAHALRPRDALDRERYGTLDYHVGKWRREHPGNYATELLDPEQQEAARERFRR